jgi:putative flippase GtrA
VTVSQARRLLRLEDSRTSRGFIFGLVGAASTIISVLIAEGLHLKLGTPLWIANLPAAQGAIFFKFYVNRSFTWNVKDNPWKRFWMHEAVCLVALVAQTAAIYITASVMHWESLLALGSGVVAGLAFNYLGNEFGVFDSNNIFLSGSIQEAYNET